MKGFSISGGSCGNNERSFHVGNKFWDTDDLLILYFKWFIKLHVIFKKNRALMVLCKTIGPNMILHLIIQCIVFHIPSLASLLLLFIPHVVNCWRRPSYISANCVSPKTLFPVLNFKQFYFDSSCMKNIWIWTSYILLLADSFGENNIIIKLTKVMKKTITVTNSKHRYTL